MGVYYETIPDSLVPWIMEQQMLWVCVTYSHLTFNFHSN
jgi:hypothetical protein